MFAVTPAPFVFLTGQPQKKGISPDAEKIQMKPVKDASVVDLSHSDHPVTNFLSVVEGIPVGPDCNNFAGLGSKEFESKGYFDIERGIHPKIQEETATCLQQNHRKGQNPVPDPTSSGDPSWTTVA